jgi:hypothetical protein
MKLKSAKSVKSKSPKPKSLAASWATTNPDDIERRIKEQAALQLRRPPEFYLRDGEEKKIRFVSSDPIALISVYVAKVKGEFRSFVAPELGVDDAFAEAGLTASSRIVYEIIDLDGYVDKKTNKRIRNLPRFYVVSPKVHEQLKVIVKKYGPLDKFDIEMSRTGSGINTTYSFFPMPPKPLSLELQKLPRLRPDFAKYYAPLPYDQAQNLLKYVTPAN